MRRTKTTDFKGGVVNKINPQRIPDNALVQAENYEYRKNPILRKRYGTNLADVNDAGVDPVYNFAVWYSGRELTGNALDKVYVVHTTESGDGDGGGTGGDPYLIVNPTSYDFGDVIGSETTTYICWGGNLTGNVAVSKTDSHFTLSTDNVTFTDTLELAIIDGTLASTTIYCKCTSTAYEDLNDTITHTSSGCTATFGVTADCQYLPEQDYLLWWLEPENVTPDSEESPVEMLSWTSNIDANGSGGNDILIPKATDYHSSEELRPLIEIEHPISIGTDTLTEYCYEKYPAQGDCINIGAVLLGSMEAFQYSESDYNGITYVIIFKPHIIGYGSNFTRTLWSFGGIYSPGGDSWHIKYEIMYYYTTSFGGQERIRFRKRSTSIGGIGSPNLYEHHIDIKDLGMASKGFVMLVGKYTPTHAGLPSGLSEIYIVGEGDSNITHKTMMVGSDSIPEPSNHTNAILVHGCSGRYVESGKIGTVYPSDSHILSSDAWRIRLDDIDDIKSIFAYYKAKYPNIFSYDVETIT